MSSLSVPEGSLSRRITRLLIANRGEIAVRIARTAHRLGISTVGVYSEPDADAMHVDAVDLAVALGGSTPAESYLRAERIVEIAREQGCDAVHPGYGFLAENADVARMVADAGLIWVGPTADQIRSLGDKVAAKKLAIESGVPTAPLFEIAGGGGGDGEVRIPDGVPMPALVKAAAGGGGRGMRVVRGADELAEAVAAGSREARSSFGDGTVFVEPYIERARHVEVQVVGDAHGNVIHLGERECSIQRRNQKIVEESPSAGITPETRAALCDGAVALARAVGYQGAGTVEFLVDEAGSVGSINFLEVNTRLQVEHPVTEAVTGVDLVELQLRVAAGEALPITQDDVTFDGHAIEVRVVAEDPAAGWLPSTGTITAFDLAGGDGASGGRDAPAAAELVRIDTGFRDGAAVSADYDSMLAKVIAHAPTRAGAAARLRRALRRSQIVGVTTNLDALVSILGEADFLAAATPTAYLDEHPDVVAASGPEGDDRVALLLAAVFATERERRAADRVTGFAPSGWRNLRTRGQRQRWSRRGAEASEQVEYTVCGDAAAVLLGAWPEPDADGAMPADERRRVAVRLLAVGEDRLAIELDGVRRVVDVDHESHPHGEWVVRTRSAAGSVVWQLEPRFVDHDAVSAGGGPVCPLPGTVIAVHVEAGRRVSEGEVLMVVEAMKMEHKITASTASIVSEVLFAVGDRVDQGDLLVALEAAPDGDGDADDEGEGS
ncbi:biotin carboxylase N-terminal domain-containing protein [Ilumatobacter sp.]|uniref:acetyl/propionyl/methylcrotonyl-CoA carboxylase subunit alpha n=1 Tax=Ilumatobacter sp. TaxID=1967498 RepID=UPI003B529985